MLACLYCFWNLIEQPHSCPVLYECTNTLGTSSEGFAPYSIPQITSTCYPKYIKTAWIAGNTDIVNWHTGNIPSKLKMQQSSFKNRVFPYAWFKKKWTAMMKRTELLWQFKKTVIADVSRSLSFLVILHFKYEYTWVCIYMYINLKYR